MNYKRSIKLAILLSLCTVYLPGISALTNEYILLELKMLKAKNAELEEDVKKLRQQNDDVSSQLIHIINTNEKMETKFEEVRTREKRQVLADSRIAFMAALSNNLGRLPGLTTIIFDNEITNVGHAYQKATGIFTAPLKGVYQFSMTFMVEPNHHEYVELTVDGRVIGINVLASASNTRDFVSTTRQWIVEINKGAQVLIRTSNFENEGFIHGTLHTVWSGFLLFETA